VRPSAFCHIAFAVLLVPGSAEASRQAGGGANQAPQFYEETATKPARVDPRRDPALSKLIALHIHGVTLDSALRAIGTKSGLRFGYDPSLLPSTAPITIDSDSISVGEALTRVLMGTQLDVQLSAAGLTSLVSSKATPARHAQESATITGHVTDSATGRGLSYATVVIEGTRLNAMANDSGVYRLERVPVGTYTLLARLLGYVAVRKSVTLGESETARADFALHRSASQLDQIVVTGTIVPTEVKALPTPITVISDSDIAAQHPHSITELFRQAVPTGVSWDQPSIPYETPFSARGASTLSPGGSQMKVFIDGIDTADPGISPVDPNSIDRIEVIRGPQAAAIYGSDAIGGVIQIFTKHGDLSLTRPQVDADATVGDVQTPYPGFRGVLRQTYSASVRGGGQDASYQFGGGYSHTADYIPYGEHSAQDNPTVFGSVHYGRGIITADFSGRYYVSNAPDVFNPALVQSGFIAFSKPNYLAIQINNQDVGSRISVAPTSWWVNTLTLGVDRVSNSDVQTRPRLTTPADTLLEIVSGSNTKTSIGYSTSVLASLGSNVSGSLTVGIDHYSLPVDQWFTVGALNNIGTIQVPPGQSIQASRSITTNTGYFAQGQLGVREQLFLTAGLRAETNSQFGDSLGTPVSPRVGLSYVQPVSGATLKFRASDGTAIRPPAPDSKFGNITPTSVTLAAPSLGPERQKGWDAGIDATFGRAAAFSVTGYDQIADDLIDYVQVAAVPVPTYQFENVGRVRNAGVEVDGTLAIGPAQLKGQYGYARARIDHLEPSYHGDLRVGDQALLTPKQTGGASLALPVMKTTTLSAGLTYVGTWNEYDFLAEYRCFGGTGPCPSPFMTRSFIRPYPSFVKANVTLSRQITPFLSGFVSANNIGNNHAYELFDFNPVWGRTTTIGLHFSH